MTLVERVARAIYDAMDKNSDEQAEIVTAIVLEEAAKELFKEPDADVEFQAAAIRALGDSDD